MTSAVFTKTMGRNKKASAWGEIDGGAAFVIPMTMLRHKNCTRLSAHANKLILDLARQYSGFNNGYLCASWSLMKAAGWKSSHTLQKATLEAEHYRIIVRTQQGGLNRPNLHALTWRKIDEKPGKPLEMRPTLKPLDSWKHDGIDDFRMPAPKARRRRGARLKAVA